MASIYFRENIRTKKKSWRVQFRAKVKKSGKKENFSASFNTKEEAIAYADKWEPIFLREGREAMKYDPLDNARRRKWGDRY